MAEGKVGVVGVADEIRHVMDEWRRLTAEGNLDGLLALLSDDVIFLTPGNPPITKNDFAKGFREVSAKARIEATQDVKEIGASGDIAVASTMLGRFWPSLAAQPSPSKWNPVRSLKANLTAPVP